MSNRQKLNPQPAPAPAKPGTVGDVVNQINDIQIQATNALTQLSGLVKILSDSLRNQVLANARLAEELALKEETKAKE